MTDFCLCPMCTGDLEPYDDYCPSCDGPCRDEHVWDDDEEWSERSEDREKF